MTHIEEFLNYIKKIKKSKPSSELRKKIFLNNICRDYKNFSELWRQRYNKNSKIYSYKEEISFYKNVLPTSVIKEINSFDALDEKKLVALHHLINIYMINIRYMCTNRFKGSIKSSSNKKRKNRTISY